MMGNNPSQFKGPKNPVETVSWDDCQAVFRKLNAKIRLRGRRKVPVAHRGAVGIRLPGGEHDALLLWGRRVGAGRICVVCRELGRQDASGGREEAERLGALRHARKRMGVVRRIGMMEVTMRSRRRTIRRGPQGARSACFAAVAGSTRRGTAGRRTATGSGPGTATTAWACASPEFWRTSRGASGAGA